MFAKTLVRLKMMIQWVTIYFFLAGFNPGPFNSEMDELLKFLDVFSVFLGLPTIFSSSTSPGGREITSALVWPQAAYLHFGVTGPGRCFCWWDGY